MVSKRTTVSLLLLVNGVRGSNTEVEGSGLNFRTSCDNSNLVWKKKQNKLKNKTWKKKNKCKKSWQETKKRDVKGRS
jgi:hypothetical protein